MPTGVEVRKEQKERLMMLLQIKAELKGIENRALENYIIMTEAAMEKEDVSWVREKAALLK
jgi:hypothetical protein